MEAFGVLSVPCPVCRARAGRPCVNRRGYLTEHGGHQRRRWAWLAVESIEAERAAAPTSGKSVEAGAAGPGATPAASCAV